jgi:hypothetical protein
VIQLLPFTTDPQIPRRCRCLVSEEISISLETYYASTLQAAKHATNLTSDSAEGRCNTLWRSWVSKNIWRPKYSRRQTTRLSSLQPLAHPTGRYTYRAEIEIDYPVGPFPFLNLILIDLQGLAPSRRSYLFCHRPATSLYSKFHGRQCGASTGGERYCWKRACSRCTVSRNSGLQRVGHRPQTCMGWGYGLFLQLSCGLSY